MKVRLKFLEELLRRGNLRTESFSMECGVNIFFSGTKSIDDSSLIFQNLEE